MKMSLFLHLNRFARKTDFHMKDFALGCFETETKGTRKWPIECRKAFVFDLALLCGWLEKLAPLSQTIKLQNNETKTNGDFFARACMYLLRRF